MGDSSLYYEVFGQKIAVTILKPTVVQGDHQYKLQGNY